MSERGAQLSFHSRKSFMTSERAQSHFYRARQGLENLKINQVAISVLSFSSVSGRIITACSSYSRLFWGYGALRTVNISTNQNLSIGAAPALTLCSVQKPNPGAMMSYLRGNCAGKKISMHRRHRLSLLGRRLSWVRAYSESAASRASLTPRSRLSSGNTVALRPLSSSACTSYKGKPSPGETDSQSMP